jgi:hypothetical protein
VHLTKSEARTVLVHRRGVLWSAHDTMTADEALEHVIERVLRRVPRRRGVRRRVTIALDMPLCRVRELEGLPPSGASDDLAEFVRMNMDAFFPRVPGGAILSPLWVADDGRIYGMAISRDVLARLQAAAKQAGWALSAIGPAMSLLERASGTPLAVRPVAVRQLAGRDATEPEWRDAVAAAELGVRLPLAWRSEAPFRFARFAARAFSVCIAAAALVSFAAATFAPALHASFVLHHLSPIDPRASIAEGEAAKMNADVRRGRALIDAAAHLRRSQRAMTSLLADVSETLPESTALAALHVDSAEGRFVAIAPSVVEVLPALGSVTRAIDPRITGSVTRENVGGVWLERATLRFRRPASP